MTKLQELATEAIQVQDACNIGGVSRRFGEVVQELSAILREEPEPFSTTKVNQHPITQLWASKIHDLTQMGLSQPEAFSAAWLTVNEIAEGRNQ